MVRNLSGEAENAWGEVMRGCVGCDAASFAYIESVIGIDYIMSPMSPMPGAPIAVAEFIFFLFGDDTFGGEEHACD